jgi:hypothetical protein
MATHLFLGLEKHFFILVVFWVPNLWSRFEALNEIFGNLGPRRMPKALTWVSLKYYAQIDLSNGVSSTPNKYCMQKLHPQEVDVSTTPIGARKPFGFSSSRVRFLDFTYVKKGFGASL